MIKYESPLWNEDKLVCGIDEVGRGCIAGPLVVCGVILPVGYYNEIINDSKSISEKKRDELFDMIIKDALEIKVEVVNEVTVDHDNIYQATKMAMERIVSDSKADYYLVDAMPLNTNKDVNSLIKGDTLSLSIAAASIVAKVIRDDIMKILDEEYPEYGFKNHKGYGTKKHLEALEKYGITDFHRKSYKPVYEQINKQLTLW